MTVAVLANPSADARNHRFVAQVQGGQAPLPQRSFGLHARSLSASSCADSKGDAASAEAY